MEEELYRVTSKSFVAGVIVVEGIITETAPILKKFVGQPFINLYKWAGEKEMMLEVL